MRRMNLINKLRLCVLIGFIFICYIQSINEHIIPQITRVLCIITVSFKLFLILKGFTFSNQNYPKISLDTIPRYTILICLYKENKNIIQQSIQAIQKIKYQQEYIECFYITEESDLKTNEYFDVIPKPNYIKKIVVPDSLPRTKPKALNFALKQIQSDFCTVYDIEDIPHPMQLQDAVNVFLNNTNISIIQYPVSIYNKHNNLVTKLFSIEYDIWFKYFLPGCNAFKTFVTIGGTSNHFRTDELIKHGGWDPFNITEDLAIAFDFLQNKKGIEYRKCCSTLGEGVGDWLSWIKQRRRWICGYLYTYLTKFWNAWNMNFKHAIGFHFLTGIGTFGLLTIPFIFWEMNISTNYFEFRIIMLIFAVVYNLIAVCEIIASKYKHPILLIMFFNVYGMIHFLAFLLALLDLLINPHYWHKTDHEATFEQSTIQKI